MLFGRVALPYAICLSGYVCESCDMHVTLVVGVSFPPLLPTVLSSLSLSLSIYSIVTLSLFMVPLQSSFAKPQTPTDVGKQTKGALELASLV